MTAQAVTVGGISVELSNTGKVFFPDEKITKGDVVEYYHGMADRMLPYLRDRPLTMMRYPDGITGHRIVQKNVPDYFPGWVSRAEVKKEGGTIRQVICDKPATLVYVANQGCIEPHIFLSRIDRLDHPDQLVVDLDPPDSSRFDAARRCALWLRTLFEDELGATCYVKTTGGHGLHVHVPLDRRADFDEVRAFVRAAAALVASRHPDVVTSEQRKDNRGGRMYLDIMRNAYAQTVVAPYAVRARPGALVATPLHWDELADSGLSPGSFTMRTIAGRLDRTDDPWAGMPRRRYGVAGLARRLGELPDRAGEEGRPRR
jgi:bifunctional non-homologous end joining protein LigD